MSDMQKLSERLGEAELDIDRIKRRIDTVAAVAIESSMSGVVKNFTLECVTGKVRVECIIVAGAMGVLTVSLGGSVFTAGGCCSVVEVDLARGSHAMTVQYVGGECRGGLLTACGRNVKLIGGV